MGKIHYGFGREYLSSWGIKEALREVYQNFIDYGEYSEDIIEIEGIVTVVISNDWQPENLEFLRIGRSEKHGNNAIGKHGEGLKMAFLIFEREDLLSRIATPNFIVVPEFYSDDNIGECFALKFLESSSNNGFEISFDCPADVFNEFKENLITELDIEFSNKHYGDIVNKTKGNIYSGGLFVANVEGLSRAYNIRPEHLPLDRDRCLPQAFDVNWASSRILEAYDKWSAKDVAYSDTAYVNSIPVAEKEKFTPVIVGNEIEFTYRSEENKQEVAPSRIKEVLRNDSFFESTIKKSRLFMVKKLGLYDMLLEFQAKHINTEQARRDFELILERVDR